MERVLFAPRDPPLLRPDAAEDLPRYQHWQAERQAQRLGAPARPASAQGPIAVVVVLDHPDPRLLGRTVRSVLDQTASAWQLAVAVTGALTTEAEATLAMARTGAGPNRFHRSDAGAGTPAARVAAHALATVTAPSFLVLGQHDRLAPDAVALLSAALDGDAETSSADLAYGDEDRIADEGFDEPVLKPGWSPELLVSSPYLGRPLAIRRAVADGAGGIQPINDGDWEHDLMLRVAEHADRITHVPEVLCHRHRDATPGGTAPGASGTVAGSAAVRASLERRGESGTVLPGPLPGSWSVRRHPTGRPTISAIIPFRDEPRLLRTCVDTVTSTTRGADLEFVLVDNGSAEPETLTLLERLAARPDVRILHDPRPFNWAALNNAAAVDAGGDILLFLNNDIEARRADWLEQMAAHAQRPDVGAVGARLLYPTGRVQHVGVVVGMGGAAGHVLAGLPAECTGYLGMAVLARDCSAVTGACLATRRSVFDEVGGFDESLGLDLNDIDFCLHAGQLGYRIVFDPLAELVHHESPSRGTSGSVDNIARFIDRWEDLIRRGDPHLNHHLTRVDSSCALGGSEEEGWWRDWRSNLER